MKFSIERKAVVGLIIVLLLMAGIGIDSYTSINQLIENSRLESDALNVRHKAQALLLTLLNLETGTRGFVITGNELYLEPYDEAVHSVSGQMAELFVVIGSVPRQQQRFNDLDKQVRLELAIEKKHVSLRQNQGFEAAARDLDTGAGKREMDQIRLLVAAIIADQDEFISQQIQRGVQQARRTTWTIGIGGVCGFLFVAVLGLIIHKNLIRRREVTEQLGQSEERLRQLVEGAREYAIFFLDTQGRIQTWNDGARRINGYERQEIIGQHFSRFYPPADIEANKPGRELETAIREGQYEEEGWRLRKNGTRFWASVLITRLLDARGNHVGFSKITRDLTERKLAEEQLHNFFTLSLDMLCIAGVDGYFKRINPAWEKILGYTEAELLAAPYLDFVHPDDRAATIAAAGLVTDTGSIARFENRYRCKAGSYRWLTWTASISADGQRQFASARDITEEKRSEEEIAALNKMLLDHNKQLESTNNELEAFSYSVSHDLRAPLRSLDGFSQALLEDCADKLEPEDQDNLRRIRGASQRMGHLIDDLLNLSRLTRVEMVRETVDLSKMAREAVQELRAGDPERDVEFVIADGLAVEMDPHLLRVALTNLLGNAWKFTSKRPHARIELGCTDEEGVKTFFVRDNGVGFDMAYSAKLFGAFQRLHAMKEFPGTGIGLATVQRIIRRHGGRIWAQSAIDAGATFNFTL